MPSKRNLNATTTSDFKSKKNRLKKLKSNGDS